MGSLFLFADLINCHMPLYDVPFILAGLDCHQANVLFQLCACHTPTSINNRHRMRLWPAICSRRQCERDKTGRDSGHSTQDTGYTNPNCLSTGRAESIAYKRDTTLPAPLIYNILTYTVSPKPQLGRGA